MYGVFRKNPKKLVIVENLGKLGDMTVEGKKIFFLYTKVSVSFEFITMFII